MSFAGPINAPRALDPVTAVRVRFMEAYSDMFSQPAYADWQKFTYLDDPAGDLIYTIYSEPLKPLRAWYNDRPMSQVDFRYWTQAVRTFGDGMEFDVDDLKDDANPAKRQMYMQASQKLGEAAAGLWPSLIVEAIVNSINRVWLPDGQKIFDNHPISIQSATAGNFRNYYANNVQGGAAATALTYSNLLTLLKAGLTFKAPNGMDYPVHYTHLGVAPGMAKTAQRLTTFDRLPAFETGGTTAAGGDVLNEIKAMYSPTVVELANLPSGMWALVDATTQGERPIALKKRQEITWQYTQGGGDVAGVPSSDEGLVSSDVFHKNKTKYGPKARGEAYFRNWWRVALADGNNVPVTSLSIVS
jgi:phage major head subunit gpT-like protein